MNDDLTPYQRWVYELQRTLGASHADALTNCKTEYFNSISASVRAFLSTLWPGATR